MEKEFIEIISRDYWVNVVENVQQNWALVGENDDGTATIYFFHDFSGVFDHIKFSSLSEVEGGLKRNYFPLRTYS